MRIPKVVKFDNGAILIYKKIKHYKSTAMIYAFRAGSLNDEVEGTAHYLEHSLFNGTKTFPTKEDVNNQLLEVCKFNAGTNYRYIKLFGLRTNKLLKESIDLAYDMMMNSNFDDASIDKERGVIQEELSSKEVRFSREVDLSHYSHVYSTSYDYPKNLGTHDSINQINSGIIKAYHKKHFVAEKCVCVAVSNLPLWKIKKEFSKRFIEKLPRDPNAVSCKPIHYPDLPESVKVYTNDAQTVDCLISIYYDVNFDTIKNRTCLSYINTLMTDFTSSTVLELRQNGLVYVFDRIGIYTNSYNSEAVLGFRTTKEKCKSVIDVMSKNFKKFFDEGMSQEMFEQRTKNLHYIDDESYSVERSTTTADNIFATYVTENEFKKLKKWDKENKKLKVEDVNDYIKILLNKKNKMYVSYMGDLTEDDVYSLEETKNKLLFE